MPIAWRPSAGEQRAAAVGKRQAPCCTLAGPLAPCLALLLACLGRGRSPEAACYRDGPSARTLLPPPPLPAAVLVPPSASCKLLLDAVLIRPFLGTPYHSLPPAERPPLDSALRGVLAETALHNRQRFPWRLLAPLLHRLIDSVLAEFTPPEEEVRAVQGAERERERSRERSIAARRATPLLPAGSTCCPPPPRAHVQGDGPPRPPPPGFEGAESLGGHLHELLRSYRGAPFTLQRLCEVLLEPRKQYARLDKVVSLG